MYTPDELKAVYAVITAQNTPIPGSISKLIVSFQQKTEELFAPKNTGDNRAEEVPTPKEQEEKPVKEVAKKK